MKNDSFKSPCPHRPACPGCPLIEVRYDEQIEIKDKTLRQVLVGYESVFASFVPALKKDRLQYRNRAKLSVRAHGRFGLFREGTHHLVHIPECLIHMDRMNELANKTMKEVLTRRLTIYDERQHKGFLRGIILRQSSLQHATLLTLITRTRVFPGGEQFARALKRKFPNLVGVIQNVNPARGNIVEGDENILLVGKDHLIDEINQLRFVVSASSFLQGHHHQAGALYQAMARQGGWDSEDVILDLYAGIGLAGLHLSTRVRQVIAVESNPQAVTDGRRTVGMNHKSNIAFFPGKVEKMLDVVRKRYGDANGMILNPPRSGCSEGVLHWIGRSQAKKLAYISCNPKSLFRDLKILEKEGFRVKMIQGFDLFPQTQQIETLALLQR